MQIQLTGNPFVDTGLFVLAYLAKVESPDQLSLDAIRAVHGDGTKLARINARLKSFTMVFGTNGPLTQTGYRPKGKKKELSDKNMAAYTGVLDAFLKEMYQPSTEYPLCEICGTEHGFDFDGVVRRAFTNAQVTDRGIKQVGREWFPLAGSTGNDAQALPSASRGLSVCAKCLFVVHYMPQALMLMQGRLVCFQSNHARIAYELTGDLVNDYREKFSATKDKIEMIGKKEGTTAVTRRLIAWMRKLQQTKREEQLPDSANLLVWLFTNAGADADCEIVAIPSHALAFLWQARKLGFEKELLGLIAGESKFPESQLLSCIQARRDYSRLYPYKTFAGAEPKFFALYHQLILSESSAALKSAQHLARARLANATPKEQRILKKAGAIEGNPKEWGLIRRLMLSMSKRGEFMAADYDLLFPTTRYHPIQVDNFRGWRTIGYYLSHPNDDVPDFSNLSTHEEVRMRPHPKIKQGALLYFQDALTSKGVKRFEKDILDNFRRTNSNPVEWLREVFIRLAKDHPEFTYGDWDDFVLDENGKPQTGELIFQMRLELANLYREYIETQSKTK